MNGGYGSLLRFVRYDDVWLWWLWWCGQDDGATPLWIASQNGHDLVVRTLLASGAIVNQSTTVSGVEGRCVGGREWRGVLA